MPLPAPAQEAFAPPAEPFEAPPSGGSDPFAFSPADMADPLPVEPDPPRGAELPVAPPPDLPLPDLAPAESSSPAADDVGFGEIEFSSPPPAAAPAPARPAGAEDAQPQEDLEMLFGADGEGAAPAAARAGGAPSGATSFKVRRRSGKVFGPFVEAQVVEMLGKGELMGNEDVSSDGGGTWTPIGAVPAFGDALRKVAAEPVASSATQAAPSAGTPFGDRMAAAKVVEGKGRPVLDSDDGEERRPLWKKLVIPLAALLVVLGVGIGAGFTKQGFFFLRSFRRGDSGKVAAMVAEARTALQRAEYAGDRAAVDAAARALAADPDGLDAAMVHAMAVAVLELRHGAPAAALDQARRNAERLAAEEKGSVAALASRLAVDLANASGPASAPQENALEAAAAKVAPDVDVVALLARSALVRGDGPRAAALFVKVEALKPGTPRGAYGAALALVAKRDAAGAKAAFEKVLQGTPAHLPSRLELAVLAEAAGDLTDAEAQLAWLLADGADQKLAPAERARALVVKGALLSRVSQKAAEADQVLEKAVQADGRLVEARLALAAHRLRRGDAQGAIAALEPLAAQAAGVPPLAALRIRALAAAGRALDASSLADQALARSPGDPALLLAKAAALEASGKASDASSLFRDAAARDPAAFEPRLALGRIALASGDLVKARTELVAAAEKGPREPVAHALLGELAAAEGDAAAAEKELAAALALDPEFALAELGLAKLAHGRGDDAVARARLERALAVDPRLVEGHVLYGTLLWRSRDLPGAEKAFQAAVDLRPAHALALSRLGAVKLERGDVDGAVQRLTAATAEDMSLAEARLWLGRALLKKGELPAAITALQKGAELAPKSAEHWVQLGVALERSGALTEAIDAYRAAAAAEPKYAEAHERLGSLFFANGRFDDAAAAYEKAVAAAPKVSRHRIALADCRAKLGKHDDAIRMFREVMKLDPASVQVVYRLARSVHESEGAKAALPHLRAGREGRQGERHAPLLPRLPLQGEGAEGPGGLGVQAVPPAQAGRRREEGHRGGDRGPDRRRREVAGRWPAETLDAPRSGRYSARPMIPFSPLALALALAVAQAPATPASPGGTPPGPPPSLQPAPPAPPQGAPAAAARTLAIRDALRLAGERNYDIKASAARLQQVEQGYWKAWSYYLPQIVLGGTYTRQQAVSLPFPVALTTPPTQAIGVPEGQQLVSQAFPVVPKEQWQGTADGSQVLFAPALWYGIKAASQGEDSARAAFENARRAILFGAAQAFYATASLRQLALVAERLLEIAQRQEKDARVRYQAGTVAKVALIRAEIDRARAEQDVLRARNSYLSARYSLAQVIDEPADFEVLDPPEPPLPAELSKMEDAAVRDRPDVKSVRSTRDAAVSQRKSIVGTYFPTVAAYGHYQDANIGGLTGAELWSAGLSARWTIFDGGLREANLREANARIREAEAGLASTESKARLEVRQAVLDLESARANAVKAKEQRDLAAENQRLVDVSFRAGSATAVEQADATTQLRNAEVAQATEGLTAQLAALRLLQAAGSDIR